MRQSVHLQKYKLFDEFTTDIPSEADVIIVSADNEKGKTSWLTALKEAYGLKAITPEPLKKGEEKGVNRFDISDKDGNPITIVYEFFADGKKSRFYAIKDGKRITELYKIKELVGTCIQYSVPEIALKLQTEKTRKEVINEIIKPLIPESVLEEISYNQAKSQESFEKRRDIKRELDALKETLKTISVSDEDKMLIGREDEAKKQLEALKKDNEKYEASKELISSVDSTIEAETKSLKSESSILESTIKSNTETVGTLENEIKALEEQITLKKARIESVNKTIEQIKSQKSLKDSAIEEIEKKYATQKIEAEAYVNNQFNLETYESNKIRIENGQKILDKIAKAKNTSESIAPVELKMKEKQDLWDKYDKEVTEFRAKVVELTQSYPLPNGLSVTDDGITIEGLVFDESQVSESKLMLTLVELLARINTAKFIHAGKYDAFGPARFKELCEIANKYNKNIYLETVAHGQNEIKVSCVINDDPTKFYTPEEILSMEEENDKNSLF